MTTTDGQRVSPEHLEVWRLLIRVHAGVIRQLEHDLVQAHGLALAWYDVLAGCARPAAPTCGASTTTPSAGSPTPSWAPSPDC